MQLTSIVGLAVVAAILCTVLVRCYPEYAAGVAVLTGVVILIAVCGAVSPIVAFMQRLAKLAMLKEEYLAAAVKILGLSWISALGGDICRDIGQTALASKVELAGRIAIILAVLPMLENLLSFAENMLGSGVV